MKKLIFLITFLITCIGYTQVQNVDGTVRLKKPGVSKAGDKVLTVDSRGLVSESTVVIDSLFNTSGGSPLRVEGTGVPSIDETDNAYRTGQLGIGETAPEELLDVVGTQAGATGAIKFDYTYADGAISRFAFGGTNGLSEIGVPASSIQANFFDYFGTGAQAGLRAYMYNGDIDNINGAAGHLSVGLGVQSLVPEVTNILTIFPRNNDDGVEFWTRLIASKTGFGLTYTTLAYNYDQNGFTSEVVNDIEVNGTNYSFTDGYARFEGGLQLNNISDYVLGHDFGTDQTDDVIGEAAYNLLADGEGNVMVEPYVTYRREVEVNSAQLSDLSTTPITLVSGQVGQYVRIKEVLISYDYVSAAYNAVEPRITYGVAGLGAAYWGTSATLDVTEDRAWEVETGLGFLPLAGVTNIVGEGVTLDAASPMGAGDGTLKVIITYEYVTN